MLNTLIIQLIYLYNKDYKENIKNRRALENNILKTKEDSKVGVLTTDCLAKSKNSNGM